MVQCTAIGAVLVIYPFGWDLELQSFTTVVKFHVVLFRKIQILIPACQCNLNSWLQRFLFAYRFPLTSWRKQCFCLSGFCLPSGTRLRLVGGRCSCLRSGEPSHGNAPRGQFPAWPAAARGQCTRVGLALCHLAALACHRVIVSFQVSPIPILYRRNGGAALFQS